MGQGTHRRPRVGRSLRRVLMLLLSMTLIGLGSLEFASAASATADDYTYRAIDWVYWGRITNYTGATATLSFKLADGVTDANIRSSGGQWQTLVGGTPACTPTGREYYQEDIEATEGD